MAGLEAVPAGAGLNDLRASGGVAVAVVLGRWDLRRSVLSRAPNHQNRNCGARGIHDTDSKFNQFMLSKGTPKGECSSREKYER